jgi:hypothetical protein
MRGNSVQHQEWEQCATRIDKELMEKWQVLGLSLMMLSQINENFYDLFK